MDGLHATRPGQKMAGFATDAALRAVPRGPVRPVRRDAARRRAERAEARRRAGAARRGPGHRGARRPDRGHGRRHPRAARPGARRGRHRHRRRDQGQPGAARHGHAGLLRRDAPGGARPAARPVGGQRHHRLRRGHRHAGRHHRRRRRRRHRDPRAPGHGGRAGRRRAGAPGGVHRRAWSPRASPSTACTRSGRRWQPAYEAWLERGTAERQQAGRRHEVQRSRPARPDPGLDRPGRLAVHGRRRTRTSTGCAP